MVGSVVEVLRAREVGGGGAEGLEESELVEGGSVGSRRVVAESVRWRGALKTQEA